MSSENFFWQNELSGQHSAPEPPQYNQNTYPTTEQRSGYNQLQVSTQQGVMGVPTISYPNFLNENTTQLQDLSGQAYVSNNQRSVITSQDSGQNDTRYSIQSGQSQETNFNTMNHHAAFNQNLIGNSNEYNNTNSKELSFNGDKTSAEPDSTSGYDESDTPLQEANDSNYSESDSESSTEEKKDGIERLWFNYALFIEHVRKHECIWDRGNKEYNCKESRKRAWWNILKRMDEEEDIEEDEDWWKAYFKRYHEHVDLFEQEWDFIENNFKECKINRKQSNLKEPPKCEFYKELEFLDGVVKNENDDVIKYPDIPDIRAIFNTSLSWCRFEYFVFGLIGKVLNGNNSCSCRNRNEVENDNKKTNDNKDSDSESLTKESLSLEIDRVQFNYRLFIKHVRKQECIWNRVDENYSNIRRRKTAWLEVLSLMDDDDMNKKWKIFYSTKYRMHVHLLEQEWKSIENNFKECKINRKRSNLKEPPKCEFYKELEFLDAVMKNENENVMTYPDVPDIRVICNIQIKYDIIYGLSSVFYHCFDMNNFRCSCSRWKNSLNRKNDKTGTSHKETLQSPFNNNIDNFNTYSNKENSERKSKEEKVTSGKVIDPKTSSFGANNMSILSEQTPHPENESSQVSERLAKETDQSTDMIELYLSLIKEVKERPCIWNRQDCDYKNRKKTKEAWEEIKSIVKPPKDVTLKSKWKTIREDFKRCQKRRNEKKVSNCRYYEDLTFLTDVVTEMPPLTTKKESAYRKQSKTSTPSASTSTSTSSDVIPPSPGIDFTRTSSNGVLVIDISDEDVSDVESIHHQNGKNDNKKTDNSMNEIETSSSWTKERMRQRGKQRMLKTGRTPKYKHRPETSSEYSERVNVDISDDNNLSTEYPVLSKTINGAVFGESSNTDSVTTPTLNTRHSTSPRCNLQTLGVDSFERINESPLKSNNNIDQRKESSHPKRKRKQNDGPHLIHRNSDIEFVEEGENFLAKALVKSLGSNEHKLLFFKQIDGKMEAFSKKQKVVAEMLIQKALTKVEFMNDEQLNETLNN